jgi:membrane protease YdiL (CAAX protease family)
MAIANVLVLVIIVACVVWQYLKSTLLQAFATIIATICSTIIAFAYFEFTAVQLCRISAIVPWAQAIAFGLLFIIVFAILLTLIEYLSKKPVKLGTLPEKIGSIICGIVLGIIIAGILLTTLILAPLPNQYPYPRFAKTATNADKPQKPLLNADGFAAGWFNIVSKGSLSGKASFTALHPDYLSQAFLNRLNLSPNIKTIADTDAIEVPRKNSRDPNSVGTWRASEQLKNTDGNPVSPKSGHYLVIVRMQLHRRAFPDVGFFTTSQIRLICTETDNADQPLTGSAINAWPIGYIKDENQLLLKKLGDQISVTPTDFKDTKAMYIDFAFNVPLEYVPVMLGFKQSSLVEVQKPVSPDQAPPAVPFDQEKNK